MCIHVTCANMTFIGVCLLVIYSQLLVKMALNFTDMQIILVSRCDQGVAHL